MRGMLDIIRSSRPDGRPRAHPIAEEPSEDADSTDSPRKKRVSLTSLSSQESESHTPVVTAQLRSSRRSSASICARETTSSPKSLSKQSVNGFLMQMGSPQVNGFVHAEQEVLGSSTGPWCPAADQQVARVSVYHMEEEDV